MPKIDPLVVCHQRTIQLPTHDLILCRRYTERVIFPRDHEGKSLRVTLWRIDITLQAPRAELTGIDPTTRRPTYRILPHRTLFTARGCKAPSTRTKESWTDTTTRTTSRTHYPTPTHILNELSRMTHLSTEDLRQWVVVGPTDD